MQLDISVRFSIAEKGRSPVSEWIKRMRQQHDDTTQKGQLESELRLHRAAIIKAKGEPFWSSIVEQVEADCKELNANFRDDIRQCCRFEKRGSDEFTLTGNTSPRHALRLNLNLDALGIAQNFLTDGVRQGERELLEFRVDKNEGIYISGLEGQLNDPGRISELLIRKVIQE